jgi:hypothetical protein
VLEAYDESNDVDGETEDSQAVTLQVTSDDGRTATMHAIPTGGGWHWILSAHDLAAYKTGRCP